MLALFGAKVCSAADARSWRSGEGHRWTDLLSPTNGHTGFSVVGAEQSGVRFTNTLEEWDSAANRVLNSGSGVALGDYDGDGRVDLFLPSLQGVSRLFRNLGGWKFQDVTAESGIHLTNRSCRGAVFADIDGDGHPDLVVSASGAGVLCFLNLGDGTFRDFTREAGTASPFGTTTLALADVDGDGTLDLYVTNYRTEDIRDRGHVDLQKQNGRLMVPPSLVNRLVVINGRVQEYGDPDLLYLNQGGGRFKPVSWMDGRFLDEEGKRLQRAPFDWGLTASFRDLNGDGAPDLYVCNDYWTPDRLWINDGNGHFRAAPKLALRHISASSMGVDFADVDRDGQLDFLVVDMLSRDPGLRKRQMPGFVPDADISGQWDSRPLVNRNTLQHARGDGTYEEVADLAGISASGWSWQPLFLDVDLDGYEDVLIATGHVKGVNDLDAIEEIQSRQHPWNRTNGMVWYQGAEMPFQKAFTTELMIHSRLYPDLKGPIVAFENLHDLKFRERTTDWGLAVDGVHHGLAMADLDNDGDLDLVVNNLGTEAGVFRNESIAPRVAVQLRGLPPNTQGIGAQIALVNGAVGRQSQEIVSGGRYLSGCQPMLTFAAGPHPGPMRLEVRWRSGLRSILTNVLAGRLYEILESGAGPFRNPGRPTPHPAFEDVSDRIAHIHTQLPFDDFERQPLLPRQLDRFGPAASWCDLDGDGLDDLVLGAGRGGRLSAFRNLGDGRFAPIESLPAEVADRSQTSVLGGVLPGSSDALLVGASALEDGDSSKPSVLGLRSSGTNGLVGIIPGSGSGVGPMVLADFHGSGALDLFVGGRLVPGRYPENPESRIYRASNEGWELDAANTAALRSVGMVCGAVSGDLDGDGFPELILACEWGPIRIFRNRQGTLQETTEEMGLGGFLGLWTGVALGDFDSDGRLDLVAGNWGLNSPWQAADERPLVLCYGDLANRGQSDLLETEYLPGTATLIPRRSLLDLLPSFPALRERFPKHQAYSMAALDEVLNGGYAVVKRHRATTLSSMMFLNRGTRFEAVPLPAQAQHAPVFGVAVGDYDGDGAEDVFLSQNFFGMPLLESRQDAGLGLWLRGDGRGGFKVIGPDESGVRVEGEGRAAALADFDGDGRVDLVVTQNLSKTCLFRNLTAAPGMQVVLEGGKGNPRGIGAVLRLEYEGRSGPARAVGAGTGWLSQNSGSQILSLSGVPSGVEVRWPGGRTTHTIVTQRLNRIRIGTDGSLR